MPRKAQRIMEKLKELLARLADTELTELSRDELAEAETLLADSGREFATAVKEKTSENPAEDIEAATEAREALKAVRERIAEVDAADAEVVAEAEKLLADFEPEASEEDEEEVEVEDETPEVEDTVEVPEAVEIVEVEAELEPVLASKPSLGAMAKRVAKDNPLPKPAIVANAGPTMPTKYNGIFSSPEEMSDAFAKAWKTAASNQRTLVASFPLEERGYEYELRHDPEHDTAAVNAAIADYKAGLKSLTAAGPCAPATPVYDFFSISQTAGMVQLPSVAAPRGGQIYPVSASYATIRDTSGWSAAAGQQTETTKVNYQVTCPSTTECTVVPFPTILQFTNMQQRFYPEFIAHSIAESMRFHDHFVNATHIAAMVTASTARNGGDTGGGGLVNVANIVNFEAMAYRDNYRMAPTDTLELVVPAWVIDALVADLVARNATTDFGNARGRVLATFASLNLNVQAVQDWQSPGDAGDTGWRTASDMLLYAPGTFVRLDGGSLDLGIVRDSTLNADNNFQVFEETFEVVCEVGHDSWLIDDVTICPRGTAAVDATLDCNPGFLS